MEMFKDVIIGVSLLFVFALFFHKLKLTKPLIPIIKLITFTRTDRLVFKNLNVLSNLVENANNKNSLSLVLKYLKSGKKLSYGPSKFLFLKITALSLLLIFILDNNAYVFNDFWRDLPNDILFSFTHIFIESPTEVLISIGTVVLIFFVGKFIRYPVSEGSIIIKNSIINNDIKEIPARNEFVKNHLIKTSEIVFGEALLYGGIEERIQSIKASYEGNILNEELDTKFFINQRAYTYKQNDNTHTAWRSVVSIDIGLPMPIFEIYEKFRGHHSVEQLQDKTTIIENCFGTNSINKKTMGRRIIIARSDDKKSFLKLLTPTVRLAVEELFIDNKNVVIQSDGKYLHIGIEIRPNCILANIDRYNYGLDSPLSFANELVDEEKFRLRKLKSILSFATDLKRMNDNNFE